MSQQAERSAAEARLNRLTDMILEALVEVAAVDAATLTVRADGSLATVSATDQRMLAIDDVQYQFDGGPCVDVLDEGESPIVLNDIQEAPRWPEFRTAAGALGVRSSLSLHVPVDGAVDVSLNVYARAQDRFDDDRVRVCAGYADQLASVLSSRELHRATARQAEQLAEAMKTGATIEQAKGILMGAHGIGADEAFDRLRRTSQNTNVKLAQVAQHVVAAAIRGKAPDV